MSSTVHALLVGIDEYVSPTVTSLRGARRDIRDVEEFLRGRIIGGLRLLTLLDERATRSGIVTAFREHLGEAGAGDIALSGHGSQEPVAPEFRHLEPTGMNQTLICHDSRHNGVQDLADKELSVLLDAVAARGVHVVAVLDCCHSGGGTRGAGGVPPRPAGRRRRTVELHPRARRQSRLRQLRGEWEVDGGRCHGIPSPSGGDPVLFAVAATRKDAPRLVRASAVEPTRTSVHPLDWRPDPARLFPVVVASVPLPPCRGRPRRGARGRPGGAGARAPRRGRSRSGRRSVTARAACARGHGLPGTSAARVDST